MRSSRTAPAIVALAILSAMASTAYAGESVSQTNFGVAFFSAFPPCPAKRMPTLESLVPVPPIIDPFAQDLIPITCQIQTRNEESGVKRVKGDYASQLVVRDNLTGMLEAFDVASGSFKTNKDGIADFDFEIPAPIFADGFESGDVSAWSYTRSDFTNNKKVVSTAFQCYWSASRSD